MNVTTTNRIVFLDFTRIIACFMVIMVHACEFFYIGPSGPKSENIFWVNFIDAGLRSCVPIFVMVSSYLLLPLKEDTESFFKKRFTRVLIPFIIWSVAYATLPVIWGEMTIEQMKESLIRLTYNFNMSAGHLWYVYMVIGVYLFMPVISPWLKEVKKKQEQWFIMLWFATTFYQYIKLFLPNILGECHWNEFTPIWYFSGYIGYVVVAHYIRTYIDWDMKKSLLVGIPMFLIGWAVTYAIFGYYIVRTDDMFFWEVGWRFCTPNVAFMTIGLFIILKTIKCKNQKVLSVVSDISKLSYGMYLMHIFFLNVMYKLISPYFNTPVTIVLVSISTYIVCYVVAKVISYLPKSKYIVG